MTTLQIIASILLLLVYGIGVVACVRLVCGSADMPGLETDEEYARRKEMEDVDDRIREGRY